jgi:hypothetical protein
MREHSVERNKLFNFIFNTLEEILNKEIFLLFDRHERLCIFDKKKFEYNSNILPFVFYELKSFVEQSAFKKYFKDEGEIFQIFIKALFYKDIVRYITNQSGGIIHYEGVNEPLSNPLQPEAVKKAYLDEIERSKIRGTIDRIKEFYNILIKIHTQKNFTFDLKNFFNEIFIQSGVSRIILSNFFSYDYEFGNKLTEFSKFDIESMEFILSFYNTNEMKLIENEYFTFLEFAYIFNKSDMYVEESSTTKRKFEFMDIDINTKYILMYIHLMYRFGLDFSKKNLEEMEQDTLHFQMNGFALLMKFEKINIHNDSFFIRLRKMKSYELVFAKGKELKRINALEAMFNRDKSFWFEDGYKLVANSLNEEDRDNFYAPMVIILGMPIANLEEFINKTKILRNKNTFYMFENFFNKYNYFYTEEKFDSYIKMINETLSILINKISSKERSRINRSYILLNTLKGILELNKAKLIKKLKNN